LSLQNLKKRNILTVDNFKQIMKMKKVVFALCTLVVFFSCSKDDQSGESNDVSYGTFTDTRDGHVYKTVKIGNQTWMAENLAYIYQSDNSESSLDPCFYVYNYSGTDLEIAKSKSNYLTYGVLYNYIAAQRVVPDGWHLPTINEWNALGNSLGGLEIAGGKMKTTLGWTSPNLKATNSSGFSALPGGVLFFPTSQGIGIQAEWWSSSSSSTPDYMTSKYLLYDNEGLMNSTHPTKHGLSVRCVKD